MKMQVMWHIFQKAFEDAGRGGQFSYEALRALFDYLEQLEQDIGEEIELDVIGLCCEYMEIEDDEEAYKEYVGDEATNEEFIIAKLRCGVLVRQG